MPNCMDVQRLIAEIKNRPTLWDVRLNEYKDRTHSARLWLEIAEIMGWDVEQCKRKWKNLRDAYRAEVRRTERRIQRLKFEGDAHPQVSDSKWIYFQPMSFMNDCKRKRYASTSNAANSSSNDHSNDSRETYTPEAAEHIDMNNYCNVKMEPQASTDDENDLIHTTESCGIAALDDDDDEEANDILFEQFKSVATPQAARRLSGTLTMGVGIGIDSNSPIHLTKIPSTATAATTATTTSLPSSSPSITATTETSTPATATATPRATSPLLAQIVAGNGSTGSTGINGSQIANCKCEKRAEDQVHFLEDLEREEQQLMQSTRRDITRASSLTHFGDSDYNFLVSFLPQMKRLSVLQNLQFRAKMSDLMLRIMSNPMVTVPTTTTNFNDINTTIPCQQGHFDCATRSTHYQQQQQQHNQHQQPKQEQKQNP